MGSSIKMLLLVVSLLACASSALAFQGAAKRIARPDLRQDVIYKGTVVAETGKTWHHAVRWIGDEGSCTGVFVEHDVMLTATHCWVGKKRGEVKNRGDIYLQFYKGSEVSDSRFVSKDEYAVYTHSSYDITDTFTRFGYDLAVVVFRKEDTLSYDRMVAELLTSTYAKSVRPGDEAVMVGAGGSGFDKGSGTLRFAYGKVTENTGSDAITVEGNNGSGICFGDSGGPVFYRSAKYPGRLFLMGILADFAMHLDNQNGDGCTPGGIYTWLNATHWNWVTKKMEAGRAKFATVRAQDRVEEERLRQERIARELEASKPEHVKLADEASQAKQLAESLAAEAQKLQDQASAKLEQARKARDIAEQKAEIARKALELFTAQQLQPQR
jgi:hypothetical protein